MAAALDAGCKKLVVGLGGSATNDGGCGAAAALGAVFLDKNGTSFVPVGRTLKQVDHIDLKFASPVERGAGHCHVRCGYACADRLARRRCSARKKARTPMVARLDAGLQNLADVVRRDTGKEFWICPAPVRPAEWAAE